MVLKAVTDGEVHVGVTKYPPGYIEQLEHNAEETYRLYKEGKIKGYSSDKEMLSDMLGDDYDKWLLANPKK